MNISRIKKLIVLLLIIIYKKIKSFLRIMTEIEVNLMILKDFMMDMMVVSIMMTLMTGIAGFKRGKYSKGKLNREVRK
jgi:hypothetical protein